MKHTIAISLIAASLGALVVWSIWTPPHTASTQGTALASLEPAGGPATVRVTGHWTIEVREPDGSTVATTEFDNAYTDDDNHLVELLTGQVTSGSLFVQLGGNPPICENPSNQASAICTITDPAAKAVYLPQVGNLTTTSGDKQITLEGQVIAQRAGAVGGVSSGVLTCAADVAPSGCLGAESSPRKLTFHALDTPVPVAKGQQVFTKVQLVFGAAN